VEKTDLKNQSFSRVLEDDDGKDDNEEEEDHTEDDKKGDGSGSYGTLLIIHGSD